MTKSNDNRPAYLYMGKPVSQETLNFMGYTVQTKLDQRDVAKLIAAPKTPVFLGYGDDDGDD